MKKRSVTHATFVIERRYDAAPERVFAAFADPEIKKRWFNGPEEWGPDQQTLDFRVGGRETSRGGPKGGPLHSMAGVYYDIVPNQRFVFCYEMHVDDERISVSLATFEFVAEARGTRLVLTEQGAYLDGHDFPAQREQGTRELLEALGRELSQPPR
jgi:uncharacterized protein YndB with AHSA1/START domain